MSRKPITVLWFGGGQDSTAILYMLVYDKEFYRQYVGDSHLLVLMSDTGNEYQSTVEHVDYIRQFCLQHDIEFYLIEPWMNYHSKAWQSLGGQFERNNNIMGVGFSKSCTDNLKIQVNYRFLSDYLRARYGYVAPGKEVFRAYRKHFGPLRSLIGFAKGEESRCAAPSEGKKDPRPEWMRLNVRHEYPLIKLGMDRANCQQFIARCGHRVPMPSNCWMCPFQADQELIYLYRFHRSDWNYWVSREQAKIDKFSHKETNLGVKGKKLLPRVLENAQKRFGHLSDDEIREYKMSHGHCIKSKI